MSWLSNSFILLISSHILFGENRCTFWCPFSATDPKNNTFSSEFHHFNHIELLTYDFSTWIQNIIFWKSVFIDCEVIKDSMMCFLVCLFNSGSKKLSFFVGILPFQSHCAHNTQFFYINSKYYFLKVYIHQLRGHQRFNVPLSKILTSLV